MEFELWQLEEERRYLRAMAEGREWGQWDTPTKFLPRYKTAHDRKSPPPPQPALEAWKRKYIAEKKSFPKSSGKFAESLRHGVGVGVGVGVGHVCASDDARIGQCQLPSHTKQEGARPDPSVGNDAADLWRVTTETVQASKDSTQENPVDTWFAQFWSGYSKWRNRAKKRAKAVFAKVVRTQTEFDAVMGRFRAQNAEMLDRPTDKRPYASTWLNSEDLSENDNTEPVEDEPRVKRQLM